MSARHGFGLNESAAEAVAAAAAKKSTLSKVRATTKPSKNI